MQQRRALIERWASADQTFRDVGFLYPPRPHKKSRVLWSLSLMRNPILIIILSLIHSSLTTIVRLCENRR